jgi:NADPH2:quinone reductase
VITGASREVGHIAIQLAKLSGAHVVAVPGRDGAAASLATVGAHEVLPSIDQLDGDVGRGPRDRGWTHVDGGLEQAPPGGRLHSIGWASSEPVRLAPNSFFSLGAYKSIRARVTLRTPHPVLEVLMGLLEAGAVSPQVGRQGSWTQMTSPPRNSSHVESQAISSWTSTDVHLRFGVQQCVLVAYWRRSRSA